MAANTNLKQQYNKQIKRIQQFIRRAEKRGYQFGPNVIPKRPKRVTSKSVERLAKITPDTLYRKAVYLDIPSGKKYPGLEGRKIERQAAQQKAKATRAANKAKKAAAGLPAVSAPKGSKPAQSAPATVPNYPRQTDLVLKNVEDKLAQWAPLASWTDFMKKLKTNDRNIAQNLLNGAINQFGRDEVARRLEANAETVIELIDEILYGSGGGDAKEGGTGRSRINFDLVTFRAILVGRSLSKEESAEVTEAVEENDYD